MPSDVQDALITDPVREDAADPRAGHRGPGPQGLQRDRHRQRPRPRRQRAVLARCAAGSTPSCCRCRPTPTRRSTSSPAGSPQLGRSLELPEMPAAVEEIRRVVTVFRELRNGVTEDGRTKLKSPTGTLSTAEAISVVTSGMALAAHFGDGMLRAGRRGRRHRRRGGQGPGVRRGGLAGVPGDRGPRARRVARLLPGRPRCLTARDSGAARRAPPRAGLGPGGASGRWRRTSPTVAADRGPARGRRPGAAGRRRGHARRRWRCWPTRGRRRPRRPGSRRRVLAVRRVLAGVAGDPVGGGARGAGPLLRPAGGRPSDPVDRRRATAEHGRRGPATRRPTATGAYGRPDRRARPRRPATTTRSAGGRTSSSTSRLPTATTSCAALAPVRGDRRGDGRGPRPRAGAAGRPSGSTRSAARRTCVPACGRRCKEYERVAVVVRRLARARADRPAAHRRRRRRGAARAAEGRRSRSPGCRGPTAGWPPGGLRRRGALPGLVPPPVHHARRDGAALAGRAAGVLRADGLPVSSAHVIEATRLAEALATMRGRPLRRAWPRSPRPPGPCCATATSCGWS